MNMKTQILLLILVLGTASGTEKTSKLFRYFGKILRSRSHRYNNDREKLAVLD